VLAAPRGDAFRLRGLLVGLTDAAAREREERILARPRLHGKVVCGHANLAKCQDDRVREVPLTGHDHQAPVVFQAAHLGQGGQQRLVEGGRGPEAHDLASCGRFGKTRRRVDGDDAPRVDERHLVAQVLGLLHVMGHEQGRDPSVPHRLHQVPGVAPGLRVEPGGQLVQHGDRRAADQGERDRESLLLSARQIPEERLALVGQAEGLHEVLRIVRVPVEGGVQQQGLSCSQLGWLGALLQLHAHPLAQRGVVRERIEAEHPDRPSVRHAEPGDALHGRGLACAVRAKQAEDLALGHAETDVLDRYSRPITPVQVRNLDDRHAGSPNALGQTRPGSSVRLKTGNRKRWQAG